MNIKTKLFQSSTARLLCIDLPEDAMFELEYDRVYEYYYLEWRTNYGYDCFDLPKGNWQILGRIEDVTENIAEKIVVKLKAKNKYRDYLYHSNLVHSFPFNSALDSFHSLVDANVLLKNPYSDDILPPDPQDYKEAEAEVFHNPVLFWEPVK